MFFDPSTITAPKLSMEHFREWAGAIANSYLTAGTPPTESLMKIAQTEELTPHQIEVLAGETNKTIHQYKYAKAEDKYFAADFPLADAKLAIGRLQADGGVLKVAVSVPEPQFQRDEFDPFAAFGVKEQTMDKTASVKRELKVASIKTASLREKIQDREIMAKFASESAEKAFIKEARQTVLSADTSLERMKQLGNVDHFVKRAGMVASSRKPLAKLAYVLGQEGLLFPQHAQRAVSYFMSKNADQKAPQDLISEWLDCKVINGQHPLYITLKTFQDASHERDLHEERHSLVDDRLRVVHQKIRAL